MYAFYTTVDNDTTGNFVMGGSTNTIGAATGAQYTSIAVGLRHNF